MAKRGILRKIKTLLSASKAFRESGETHTVHLQCDEGLYNIGGSIYMLAPVTSALSPSEFALAQLRNYPRSPLGM